MPDQINNRTIFCRDNLDILQGMNSNSIDLIYLDPPFNKKKVFTAPIGTAASGASFRDIFQTKDVKAEWITTIKEDNEALFYFLNGIKQMKSKGGGANYNFCYLVYMSVRLIECHRILKVTGSLYLHCDPTMSHFLKLLLDCIFGEQNFRNEVIWFYKTGGTSKKYFSKKHDVLLFYAKDYQKQFFNFLRVKSYLAHKYGFKNIKLQHDAQGIYTLVGCRDVWDIPGLRGNSPETTGYPTQKPISLLKRVIEASCPNGGIVLDPFCGCATTCVAAELLSRRWIGIDISHKAYELVQARLTRSIPTIFNWRDKIYYRTDIPQRTDQNINYRKTKYVYVISHPQYPHEFKVGIAQNWKTRLSSYQTADPNRAYKMEFKVLSPDYHVIEQQIHRTFPSKHEWVSADLSEIIAQIKNLVTI